MNDEKTFTQADVDRIVAERLERDRRNRGVSSAQRYTQADVDRIVAERLQARNQAPEAGALAAAAHEAQADNIAAHGTQADDLTAPTPEAQPAPDSIDYEQRVHELENQLLHAKAREVLAKRNIPMRLSNMLDYSSAEACMDSINNLEEAYKESVQDGVNARISKGTTKLPRPDRPFDPKHNDNDYYAALFGGRL